MKLLLTFSGSTVLAEVRKEASLRSGASKVRTDLGMPHRRNGEPPQGAWRRDMGDAAQAHAVMGDRRMETGKIHLLGGAIVLCHPCDAAGADRMAGLSPSF